MDNKSKNQYNIENLFDSILSVNCPIFNHYQLKIKLSHNDCKYLSNKLKVSSVKTLVLDYYNIHSDGLKLILSILKHTKVENLVIIAPMERNDRNDREENNGVKLIKLEETSELSDALKHSQLISLQLTGFILDNCGMNALVDGLTSSRVEKLILTLDIISNVGKKALADCLKNTNIAEFGLSSNLVTKYFLKKLGESKIKTLQLSDNRFEIDGLKTLADILSDTAITLLDLSRCEIDFTNIELLSKGLKHSKVIVLKISNNKITVNGCLSIGNIIKYTKITQLDVSMIGITSEGVKSLAENISKSEIRKLDLGSNFLKNDGAILLANGIKNSKLTYLNVNKNEMTGIGISALLNAINSTEITDLDVGNNLIGVDEAKKFATAIKKINNKPINLDLSNCFTLESGKRFCMEFQPDKNIPEECKIKFIFDESFSDDHLCQLRTIKALKFFNVVYLEFNNKITIDDIVMIKRARNQILILKLWNIHMAVELFNELIGAVKRSTIKVLHFSECTLNNEHAKIVADNLRNLNLELFSFPIKNIRFKDIALILNELKYSRVRHLIVALQGMYDVFKINPDTIDRLLNGSKFIIERFTPLSIQLKFNELSFQKVRHLIESFDKNVEIKFSPVLLEHFQAYYDYIENGSELWNGIENPEKIDKNIRLKVSEHFFDLIDAYGNKKKTFFDEIPGEMREMIASYLSINDILIT